MNQEKVHTNFQTCGILFKTDFSHLSYPYYDDVVNLYDAYKKGCLPFQGSASDQPGQIMNIFVLLNNLYVETEEKQRKEQESKNKKARSKR